MHANRTTKRTTGNLHTTTLVVVPAPADTTTDTAPQPVRVGTLRAVHPVEAAALAGETRYAESTGTGEPAGDPRADDLIAMVERALAPTPRAGTTRAEAVAGHMAESFEAGLTACANRMSPEEFDAQFIAAMPRLRRRLISLTGNPHDADDLLQETYLRLSHRARIRTLARQEHPYAYTCAAATNLLRDSWLHPSRRERSTDRLPEQGWDGGLAAREAEAVTVALLRVLSPKEAAAVILIDLEGLTHDQAAERLGTHRGTVQRNRMRALAKMRAALGSYETAPRPVTTTKTRGGADRARVAAPRAAAA
ncbi:RNA polymerase sigma factor [Streptomyces sp. NPDC050585]|uniref:RNA polymerase sigma factor n=2 Tax=unclassified Streptomyces TaxID=2593676 RepID=UPI0037B9F29A